MPHLPATVHNRFFHTTPSCITLAPPDAGKEQVMTRDDLLQLLLVERFAPSPTPHPTVDDATPQRIQNMVDGVWELLKLNEQRNIRHEVA
jgi:hypothetical protein